MIIAMEEAEKAVQDGNAPFGVVVADSSDEIIWRDHDRVKENMDPTAHGEVNAIRGLCKKLGTTKLEGATFYTTSEPCPTCLTAMIKAKVSRSIYGAKTESDASLPLSAEELASKSKKHPIEVSGGVLANECREQRERLLSSS